MYVHSTLEKCNSMIINLYSDLYSIILDIGLCSEITYLYPKIRILIELFF